MGPILRFFRSLLLGNYHIGYYIRGHIIGLYTVSCVHEVGILPENNGESNGKRTWEIAQNRA